MNATVFSLKWKVRICLRDTWRVVLWHLYLQFEKYVTIMWDVPKRKQNNVPHWLICHLLKHLVQAPMEWYFNLNSRVVHKFQNLCLAMGCCKMCRGEQWGKSKDWEGNYKKLESKIAKRNTRGFIWPLGFYSTICFCPQETSYYATCSNVRWGTDKKVCFMLLCWQVAISNRQSVKVLVLCFPNEQEWEKIRYITETVWQKAVAVTPFRQLEEELKAS